MTDMSDRSGAGPDEIALRRYAKRELRQRMQNVRNALPASAHADRSARACERASQLSEFASAHTIAGYCAMRKELNPDALLARAHALGKQVALPRVQGAELSFHLHRPGEPLVENDWGVLEPADDAELVPPDAIDLVLVPALALDLRGFRIGYGKGFYDRTLPRMPRARSVGLCYEFQMLAELPNEAHDVALHWVISDARCVQVDSAPASPAR